MSSPAHWNAALCRDWAIIQYIYMQSKLKAEATDKNIKYKQMRLTDCNDVQISLSKFTNIGSVFLPCSFINICTIIDKE